MDKNYLIKLTQYLYNLTLLFPKKEPLRYKMRETSDEILADFISFSHSDKYSKMVRNLQQLLDVLDSFFEVAKNQNWVSGGDISRIQEEYKGIKVEIKKIAKQSSEKERARPRKSQFPSSRLERQKKILVFLKENGQAQVWQIKQILSEVSKRTLRRDFQFLLKQGIIEKIGERNKIFYQLKVRT